MMPGILRIGYYSILLSILLLLAAGVAILWYFDYETFTLLLAKSSGKMSVLPMVRSRFFTPSKFEFARIVLVLVLFGYLVLLPYLVKRATTATNAVIKVVHETGLFAKAWVELIWPGTISQKICFAALFFLLLVKTAYYLQYPVQYDEAWTYNYFISGNFFVALAVYNNHPMYVLLAWLFKFLPFAAAFNMRLPVVIFGVLTVMSMIGFLRYFYTYNIALAAAAFFAFSGPVTFYMLYARGYMLLTFFVIVSAYSMFRMLDEAALNKGGTFWNKWQFVYVFACAFGFYSMPSFIYHFFAMLCYVVLSAFWLKNRVLWGRLLAIHAVAALLTVLLYMPMLLGTGVGLGLNAATDANTWFWVWQHVQHYVNRCWYFLFGTALSNRVLAILAVLIVGFYQTGNNIQRKLTAFSVFSIGIIILSYVLQRVYIPERIWAYQLVFISCLAALMLNGLYRLSPLNLRNYILLFVSVILVAFNSYMAYRHDFVNWSLARDNNSKEIASIFLQNNVRRYYLNFDYYKPMLEFYYKTRNKNLYAVMGNRGSVDYAPFNPVEAGYDAIIWDKCAEPLPLPVTTTYGLVFSDEEVEVWVKQ